MRKLVMMGILMTLAAACAKTGQPPPENLAVKKWYNASLVPAIEEMAKATLDAKGQKEGCARALEVLDARAPSLQKTPDAEVSRLMGAFIQDRRQSYMRCAEGGPLSPPSQSEAELRGKLKELIR